MNDLNWISWVTCCSFHISMGCFTLHFCLRQMTSFLKPYEPTSASFTFLGQLPHLSVVSLCDPMDCRTSGFTVSQSLLKLMSIESVMSSNHLILCRTLLLLPSIFPSIGVFSSESVISIRWPEYWSFSFSISILPVNTSIPPNVSLCPLVIHLWFHTCPQLNTDVLLLRISFHF